MKCISQSPDLNPIEGGCLSTEEFYMEQWSKKKIITNYANLYLRNTVGDIQGAIAAARMEVTCQILRLF